MNRAFPILIALSFAAGVAFSPWAAPSVQAQFREVTTTSLMDVDLGAWCEGKEVIVELKEYGSGVSDRHYHPVHSFAWTLEGSQVKMVEGQSPVTANAGELLHEGPMEVHISRTDTPTKILLWRIVEKGATVTNYVP